MKRTLLYILCSLIPLLAVQAQTRLFVRGSAVPGGLQELTRFSTSTGSQYAFKFHGKLLPGDLYITTTNTPKSTSRYYAPKLVDTNIVTLVTAAAVEPLPKMTKQALAHCIWDRALTL